ncbi:YfhO family protein [uncultured Secundilactobacillus sp.]|uniref:YfhO family protein n=1 Tax=uncultured Secundilactobacillus sp. TaxID=2813935 RepID=UPI002584163D|nr:YfhO family protein [uncultured Secundilactobacillus sp.]
MHSPHHTPHRIPTWLLLLLAFGLPLLITSIVFTINHIAPFGNNVLMFSDGGAQYVPFFSRFRADLLAGHLPTYSFALSLGDNTVPLFAYYLMSPFNLLLLAFPANQVPLALSVILMLKIATIGLTASIYFKFTYRENRLTSILFSTAFALCGFVAGYYYTIMWLDALILLPLVMLGVQRLVTYKRADLYVITLWLTLVTNYYLGYMTCLFVVLYFGYLLVADRQPQEGWQRFINRHLRQIGHFLLVSIFSGLMSFWLLLPTLLGMMKTGKASLNWVSWLPFPSFGPEVLAQFGMGADTFLARKSHAPAVFVGSFVLILLVSYFLTPQIKHQVKRRSGWFLTLLGLCMLLTTLNTIWHAFQQPQGFPFRQVYFFSFVCIILGYEAWRTRPVQNLNRRQQRLTLWIPVGLICIGYLVDWTVPNLIFGIFHNSDLPYYYTNQQPGTSLLMSVTAIGLTWLAVFRLRNRQVQAMALTLVVGVELGGNYLVNMTDAGYGSASLYATRYQTEKAMLAPYQNSANFSRIDTTASLLNGVRTDKLNSYNDPVLFGYNGLTSYSSTLNEQTRQMLRNLGLFSRNARRIGSPGTTPITDLLFGVAHRLDFLTENTVAVTQPTSFAGTAYFVPRAIKQVQLQSQQAFTNLETIMQAFSPRNNSYLARVSHLISTKKDHHDGLSDYRFTFTVRHSGPLFFYPTNGTQVQYTNLTVNGHVKSRNVADDFIPAVTPLGTFKVGDKVTVTITGHSQDQRRNYQFATLDTVAVDQVAARLATQPVTVKQTRYNALTISAQTSTARLLYMSIPADEGWQLTVNHQPIQPIKIINGMMGVQLPKGHSTVKLTYKVPGLTAGILASLMGLIGFSWTQLHARRRLRNQQSID